MVRLSGVIATTCAAVSTVASCAAITDAALEGAGSGFVGVAGAMGAAAIGGTIVAARSLMRHRTPLDGRTSDLLEVVRWDDDWYVTKGGAVGGVVRLRGVDYGSRADSEHELLAELRSRVYRDIARHGLRLKVWCQRKRRKVIEVNYSGHPVLDEITERWQRRFDDSAFENHYYLILEEEKGDIKKLAEGMRAAIEGLREYSAVRLSSLDMARLEAEKINGRDVLVDQINDLTEVVEAVRLGFVHEDGRVIQREDGRERVTGAASILGWGKQDTHTMVDGFLTLPLEMEILMIIKPWDRDAQALALLADKRQSTMIMSTSETHQEFAEGIARVNNDEDLFFPTQLTIFVSGSDEEVDTALADCRQWARRFSHELKSETTTVEALWRSRLLGVAVMVRERRLQSINIGKLIRWDAPPKGLEKCDWGAGPARVYATLSGAPYPFCLHATDGERAVAHTLIIAPTGGGKTATTLHLLGGCLSYPGVRGVVFDSGQGMRPFCEAVGSYIRVGQDGGLNPLQNMTTDADEMFVNRWLRMLAGVDGAEAYEEAERAIEAIRDVAPERRSLRSVHKQAFQSGALKTGLKRWAAESGIGRIFNGTDNLSFAGTVTGFAMDELYDVPEAVAAVTDYVIDRIKKELIASGEGFVIFVDEAPRLLSNPVFAPEVEKWLLEIRKARGAAMLAFQTPKKLFDCSIATSVMESCATKILFPNADGAWEDYEALGCTRAQFERLRKPEKGRFWALFLRQGESVILDLDLTQIGGMLRLYRGGPQESLLMRALQDQHGEDWVWQYVGG